MPKIKKMRLPTCAEYDLLAKTAEESDDIMHWRKMYSWCQDVDPDWASTRAVRGRAVRGYRSARYWNNFSAAYRSANVGFRPAFEILGSGPLLPDRTIVTVGTLYMDGTPVKVPQNPTKDGDIPDYIPGTKLELRDALDDPACQVQAIKVGDILIADRVLLRNISWDDLDKQGLCINFDNKILEGETNMKNNTSIICLDDEVFGACAIACSQANENKVRSFLAKRYPKWARQCVGKSGLTPWNDVLDAVEDMKEMLGDDNLEFLGGCAIVRFPNQH